MKSILSKISFVFLVFAFFLLLVGKVFASYPQPHNYVNDFGNVLSQPFEDKLNKKLSDFEQDTKDQIAVVTVDTTGNESIEEYANGLFSQWGIGQKGEDNGLLFLFAMKDRKMRIEVGRGLEGTITDIQSKEVIDEQIVPEFKDKNYESGIEKGVNQILYEIDPKATESGILTPKESVPSSNNSDGILPTIIILLVAISIIVIVVRIMTQNSFSSEMSGESSIFDDDRPGSGLGSAIGGGIIGGVIGGTLSSDDDDDDSGSGFGSGSSDSNSGSSFGGFGGGGSSGGGSSGGW